MDVTHSKMIEELYLEMFDKLKAYARSVLENEALAEEAVQETFRIACQKPEDVCSCPNPQGWIFITLKHTIHNIQSNRATAKRILEMYLLVEAGETAFSDDKLRIEIAYENVADTEEFQLLKEMAIEGRSHEEMAAARGITVSACKKRVQRAKEKLQKKLLHVSKR